MVDLRSDTVTLPTQEMRAAMVEAPLGDDVLGHDPTTRKLEEAAAVLTEKEDAIFVPSGTMGNQVALATHCRPGDSALFEDGAHMLFYEGAGPALFAGVLPRTVAASDGVLTPDLLDGKVLTRSEHTPGTTVLCLENTHNRAGGTVTTVAQHAALRAWADRHGLRIHLDGARVFNAAVALGVPVGEVTRQVDTVNFCLSKGLGCPVGSVLAGPADFIAEARYWRKRLGGGMRQSGVLAACGLVALATMIDRLADDHARTRALYEATVGLPGIRPLAPATNILMIDTDAPAVSWVDGLAEMGVLGYSFGPHRIRLVFHYGVDDAGLATAVEAFRQLAGSGRYSVSPAS